MLRMQAMQAEPQPHTIPNSLKVPRVRRLIATFIPGIILLATACSSDTELPTRPDTQAVPSESTGGVSLGNSNGSTETLQVLARSLAMAMAEPNVRASVLRGMRGSSFNEHKLVLSDFLSSGAGSQLRNQASQSAAIDAILSDLDTQFPNGFDFYVPSPGQRRNWIGTGRLLVVAVSDTDVTEAQAFDTSGSEVRISSLDVPGYDAVLVIHPAEPKAQLGNSQPVEGNTIEDDPGVVESDATSNQVCQIEQCEPGGGGPPSPPPPPPPQPGTKVNRIFPDFDDGFLGGNVEVYFVTVDLNQPTQSAVSAKSSIKPRIFTNVDVTIFGNSASFIFPLRIEMWESDGFLIFDDDDYKGESIPTPVIDARTVVSFDPFNQEFWGEYRVVVGS